MRLTRLCLGVALCAAAVGSASAARQPKIVSQSELGQYWQPVDATAPAPFRLANGSLGNVCVSLGYQIKADGSTAEFSLLKSWSSAGEIAPETGKLDPLVQAAAGVASQRRFSPVPAAGKGTAVYTAGVFVFLADAQADAAQIGGHCDIGDLKQFIADAQAEAFKRGDIEKAKLERSQRDFTPGDAAAQRYQQRQGRTPR